MAELHTSNQWIIIRELEFKYIDVAQTAFTQITQSLKICRKIVFTDQVYRKIFVRVTYVFPNMIHLLNLEETDHVLLC